MLRYTASVNVRQYTLKQRNDILLSLAQPPRLIMCSGGIVQYTQSYSTDERLVKTKEMLKSGADPNAKDSSGKTCLHHLVLRNLMDEELIDLLILSGASPDITDNDGNTPLLLAASLQEIETTLLESRNRELMKKLILAGANIDKTDSKGQTSLHCAAYLRKREAVRLLLSEGALPNISDELGNTPLICALTDNYPYSWKIESPIPLCDRKHWSGITLEQLFVEFTERFISAGADVNAADKSGKTVLHCACILGSLGSVNLLLSHGASIKAVDEHGENALIIAVSYGKVEVVRQLIQAGSDVNYIIERHTYRDDYGRHPENPMTALHFALHDANIVKYLLEHGANPNQTNSQGESILLYTLGGSDLSNLKLLLSHGADMYDSGKDNPHSPFQILVRYDESSRPVPRGGDLYTAIQARVLLENGLDLNRYKPQTPQDFSPLHEAIWTNHKSDMLALLLEYNTKGVLNLEHEDQNGDSPLCVAVKRKSPDCIKLLLEYGADIEHADSKGRTPLKIAVSDENIYRFFPIALGYQMVRKVDTVSIRHLIGAGAKIRNILHNLVPDTDEFSELSEKDKGRIYARPPTGDKRQYELVRYRFEVAKCIVLYRILYESRRKTVDEPLENGNMGGSIKLREFCETCKVEIVQLKNAPVSKLISYYDVLIDKDFYKHVRDFRVYKAFQIKGLESRFPLYGKDLSEIIRNMKRMHFIWERAVRKLSKYLRRFFNPNSYYSIIRNILECLKQEDLETLSGIYDLPTSFKSVRI